MNFASNHSSYLPFLTLVFQIIACIFLALKAAEIGRRMNVVTGLLTSLALVLAGITVKLISVPGLPVQDFVNQSLAFGLIALGAGFFAAQDRRA